MSTTTIPFRAPSRSLVAAGLAAGLLGGLGLVANADAAAGDSTTPDATPRVEFAGITDGDHVAGPLVVEMEATGVAIEPAGEAHDGAGHFHIITTGGCVEPGETIPRSATSIHFGDGSTTATLYLAPGTYDLCLQLGDGQHVATDLTDTVTVDVGIETHDEWCAVAEAVDDVTGPVSVETDDLATLQPAYAAGLAYAEQLLDGIDTIDPDHRASIETLIGLLRDFARTVVEGDDIEQVRADTDAVLATVDDAALEPAYEDLAEECDLPYDY